MARHRPSKTAGLETPVKARLLVRKSRFMQGHLISPILQRCLSCDQMLPRHDGAHLLGAELNWHSLNECFRRDHVLRCIYIFYEVCRIDMCVVCNLIGVNLKESKFRRIILFSDSVDCQHAGLDTDRGLDLFLDCRRVTFQSLRIDLKLGNTDKWHVNLLGNDAAVQVRSKERADASRQCSPVHYLASITAKASRCNFKATTAELSTTIALTRKTTPNPALLAIRPRTGPETPSAMSRQAV